MMDWHSLNINTRGASSGQLKTTCPKCSHLRHKPNEPCLSVDLDQGMWNCHNPGCGFSGSIHAGDWRIAPPRTRQYEPPRPLPAVTIPTLWEKAVQWFATRGIPEHVLVEHGVTASDEYCPVCEKAVGNVLFPYRVGGVHVNTKHRCGNKHFRMEKGAQRVLYNMDGCADAEEIVIVEGEIDALSLIAAGVPNVVSVPDGAPSPTSSSYSTKFSFLEAAEDFIASRRHIILAVDSDDAGKRLADELSRRIGPEKCSRVVWPDGIKDANELLLRNGEDALVQTLGNARPYPVEGIVSGEDLIHELLDLYDYGEQKGADFGQPHLDQLCSVRLGHMSIWTGVPSHGKSTVLDQCLVWLAERHGWAFTVFSPEQQPLRLHQRDLIRQYIGKSFRKTDATAMSRDDVLRGNGWVSEHFSFLLPEDTGIDSILRLARIEVYRRGIRGIVIDPWNEIEHSRPKHQNETEYTSYALTKIRQFARTHDVHVWVVAHPTKMRRTDDGAEPIPNLWDVSGSANFRNKADIGVTIWRDLSRKDRNQVELHVTKMRFDDVGELGHVTFGYDTASKRLYEIGAAT